MSGFVKALDSYLRGRLSRDELFSEVDRLLASGAAESSILLSALYDEHAHARLPDAVHGELVRKLLRQGANADVDKAQARPAAGSAVRGDSATVVSDDSGSNVIGAVAPLPAS